MISRKLIASIIFFLISIASARAGFVIFGLVNTAPPACPQGSSYADGCSGAPSGAPQFPNILNLSSTTNGLGHNLHSRSPWNVAGVDYYVGIDRVAFPTNASLSDPVPGGTTVAAALQALGANASLLNGVTIQFTNCTGTINGWDFSLHGGIGILVNSGSCTFSNDNIVAGTNGARILQLGSGTTNIVVKNSVIDGGTVGPITEGGGTLNTEGVLESNCPNLTVEYSLIQNGWAETVRLGSDTKTGFTTLLEFNAIGNAGLGQPQGLHGDLAQILAGSGNIVNSVDWEFNFFFQTNTTTGVATQGISYNGTPSSGTSAFVNETEQYNTLVSTTNVSGFVGEFVNYDYSWLQTLQEANYNYVDITNMNQSSGNIWWFPANGSGPFGGDTRYSTTGNINMLTGAALNGS